MTLPCPLCHSDKLNRFSHWTFLDDGMKEIPMIQCTACYCEASVVVWQRPRKATAGAAAWALVEALREAEGNTVTLVCDNPDFNGQPNCLVECCGDWTNYETHRFPGDTMMDALKAAYLLMITPALNALLPEGRSHG